MGDSVQEIKSRLNILDVIRDYVQLKPAGSSWKGVCPFHNEKTPSFFVSPERQVWHCFGCSEGGDLFSFVMKREGFDFREALEMLATRAGVTLERVDPRVRSQKSALSEMLERAARWYRVVLKRPEAAAARAYLTTRGITEDVIDRWGIGYAPDSWDRLANELAGQAYRREDVLASGLVISRPAERSVQKNSVPYYDRFRNRIMFPIRDLQGRIVGFGGRVMSGGAGPGFAGPDTKSEPKYINSPETPVYEKSKILFALDRAKDAIRKEGHVIVVEGYMDAITAHEAGYSNVVATSGTALTPKHVEIMKRYTDHVTLSFDEDAAGRAAVERGIDATLHAGMSVAVLSIPDGKDPDECIRHDRGAWDRAVAARQPFLDYLFSRTVHGRDMTRVEDKKQTAKILLSWIAKLSNTVEQTHYLQELSRILHVSEDVLRGAMRPTVQSSDQGSSNPRPGAKTLEHRSRVLRAGERLLGILLREPARIQKIVSIITPDMFVDPRAGALYKAFISLYTQHTTSTDALPYVSATEGRPRQDFFSFEDFVSSYPDHRIYGHEILLRFEQEFQDPSTVTLERELEENALTLRKASIQSAIEHVSDALRRSPDDPTSARLTEEFNRLSEALHALDREEATR